MIFVFVDLFPEEDTTYQVFVTGAVAYGTPESTTVAKEKRLFSHVFILTVDVLTSTWVIANECFRFHEWSECRFLFSLLFKRKCLLKTDFLRFRERSERFLSTIGNHSEIDMITESEDIVVGGIDRCRLADERQAEENVIELFIKPNKPRDAARCANR